jgi:hypothetical protein
MFSCVCGGHPCTRRKNPQKCILNSACIPKKQQLFILYSLVWPNMSSNPRSTTHETNTRIITPRMRCGTLMLLYYWHNWKKHSTEQEVSQNFNVVELLTNWKKNSTEQEVSQNFNVVVLLTNWKKHSTEQEVSQKCNVVVLLTNWKKHSTEQEVSQKCNVVVLLTNWKKHSTEQEVSQNLCQL